MTIRSQPYFVLDIPTISDIRGRFKYHYFSTGESMYPADEDPTIDQRTKASYGIPRKIIIEVEDSIRELAKDSTITQQVAENILKTANVAKAEAEAQLQNKNASRLTFNADDEFLENIYVHPDFDSSNDHYDMAIKLINNADPDTKQIISRVLENSKIPGPIEFDASTNLPVTEFDEQKANLKTSSVIMDSVLGDLVASISNDGISSFSDDFIQFENRAMLRQNESRSNQKYGKFNPSDYSMSIEVLDETYVRSEGVIPIGIILYKTRVEGDERIPEAPILITNRNKKTVEDKNVMYGATYEYSVHTIAIASAKSSDYRGKYHNFLVLSKDSKKISIECIERNPPPAPDDVNFTFLDSTMLIKWQLPIQTDEKLIPINDIKYVQVFKRSSIHEAFSLISMYDFNDSLQVVPLDENVPSERIKLTSQSDNELEVKLPDKGEYQVYSVACVDAHGNSSFLGPQFAVYLDSLNQPRIEHVAYPGSPKQYPNMTIINDVFEDSIKASGYTGLTIYHNPNFTILRNGKITQKLVSTNRDVASYILQMIDVETQTDQTIEIFMREN